MALALLGATAGQGVVWYTGQFYALFFLTLILKVDPLTAYEMIGLSLLLGTPFFIVFGWLSDRIGRLKIILAGCTKINWLMAEMILAIMVIYVTVVYGPIAAFLVEMFPTKIRYTSMSLPYHIGNGWFGGVLPLVATALVAAYGDICAGLWYPIIVAVMTFVIGSLLLVETKDVDIVEGSGVEAHLGS